MLGIAILFKGDAWVLKTRPDTTLARLENFASTLPQILTLRWCHRFGQGEHAYITALSEELIELIAQFIFQSGIREAEDEWSELLRCLEACCRPSDHVPRDQWLMIRDEAVDFLEHSGYNVPDCLTNEEEIRLVMDQICRERPERQVQRLRFYYGDVHDARLLEWCDRTSTLEHSGSKKSSVVTHLQKASLDD